MRLIQTRVRCVAGVRDSGWFVPGRKTTLLYGEPGSGKTALFRALQALNPPYDVKRRLPLADHPRSWQQQGYSRRVIPGRKTAVYMVFSARAEQIPVLAKIDPALFETDRIEVGRRLDHSRWTTFVEIAASARWGEIREEMNRLWAAVRDRAELPELSLLEDLQESDRLKGEIGDQCLQWLKDIAPLVADELAATHATCLRAVTRRERFFQAERQVARWLPLTLHLAPDDAQTAEPLLAEKADDADLPVAARLAGSFLQLAASLGQDAAAARFAGMLEDCRPLARLFADQGLDFPDLQFGNGTLMTGRPPGNAVARRCRYIGLVCQLAALVRDGRPLLLLDDFAGGLEPEEQVRMAGFLQGLGDWCQLLAATSDRQLARRGGWHACLRIGAKTLEEGGRVDVMT